MTFSPILAALVWATFALLFFAGIWLLRNPSVRPSLRGALANPWRQAAAVFVAATLATALLAAIPLERDGRTDTLLQATLEATGAGISESGASAPFALATDAGDPLKHAGAKRPADTPVLVHVVKYTLVAIIAGGVTSFTAILFTAAVLGARRGQTLIEGIQMLSTFFWRPAIMTGTVLWMTLTWLLLLWPDWHVLGTTAAGTDVMALITGLLPWITCISAWSLAFAFWKAVHNPA